jgi:glyoxylase-like metal-dependent hydrolase (beta-lactamase superfamily II)
MKTLFFSALALALASCARSPSPPSMPENLSVVVRHEDDKNAAQVGEYVSSWNGFRTSSYWIEGPSGLILIDTQFLLSAAEEFVNLAEKTTGKKAVLAVVLHPNPDKFNGTALYQNRGIKVITSSQVLAKIPGVHKLRTGWFEKRFRPDYPTEEPKPESFGDKTTEVEAAGIKLKLHVLGAGCSDAHVVAQYGSHLFPGDLVTIGFHSWLELGLLDEWLQRISELQELKPEHVHTGRGGTGTAEALDREAQYLWDVVREVK